MRDLRIVLWEIVEISEKVEKLQFFTEKVESLLTEMRYTAPEDMYRHWQRVQSLVNGAFDTDESKLTAEEKQIIDIWMGKRQSMK